MPAQRDWRVGAAWLACRHSDATLCWLAVVTVYQYVAFAMLTGSLSNHAPRTVVELCLWQSLMRQNELCDSCHWLAVHCQTVDDDNDYYCYYNHCRTLLLLSVWCLCAEARHYGATALNEHSSRSHVIFRIVSHLYCHFSFTSAFHQLTDYYYYHYHK